MSADYYGRLEQRRGPQPSEQMLAAIARGLRLTLDERDHLFRLAGHAPPQRALRTDHVDAGLMRVLDRLDDTPAMVRQRARGRRWCRTRWRSRWSATRRRYEGLARSVVYRWLTDPASRDLYPPQDQDGHGRSFAADLRVAYARDGAGSRAAEMVDDLLAARPSSRGCGRRTTWAASTRG